MNRFYPFILLIVGGLVLGVAFQGIGFAGDAAPAAEDHPFTWSDLVHMIKAGGVTMYPLGLLSIGALAYSIERLVRLRKQRLSPSGLSDRCRDLWTKGDFAGVVKVAQESRSALGKAIQVLVEFRGNPVEQVLVTASNAATAELLPHIRSCKPLIIIATTGPLLGLFGTILGMIGAFRKYEAIGNAGGDPSTFAGNISEALVTAASGLIIAAYSLFLYHIFKNRALRIGDEMHAEINSLAMEWLMKRHGAPTPAEKA